MLLRFYRITDRFGTVAIKLSAAAADWLLVGADTLTHTTRRGSGGILALLLALLILLRDAVVGLLRLIWRGVRGVAGAIWRVILLIFGALAALVALVVTGFRRLFGLLFNAGGSAASAGTRGARAAVSGTMARRAARSEIDTVVVEDPLRSQNRRLSFLVVALGVIVVGVVLWATDPARNGARPVAVVDGDPSSRFMLDAASTPQPTEASSLAMIGLATPVPTATAVPPALRTGGMLAYTVRERGQTDLWLSGIGMGESLRITNSPEDERDPAWSSDGLRLAYSSRQDGNWELYIYRLDIPVSEAADNPQRITFDLSFQGNPDWSPDSEWLVYESYQGQNLDLYALNLSQNQLQRLTDHPAPDFSPAWSPATGRQIAFVSWRDGNQDIYLINLDTSELINLTNTPHLNEDHPVWRPDGRAVAYSAVELGREKVFVKSVENPTEPAEVLALGRHPTWSPDGGNLAFAVDATDGARAYIYALPVEGGGTAAQVLSAPVGATDVAWSAQTMPPRLLNSGGLPLGVDDLFVEQVTRRDSPGTPPIGLQNLPGVQAPQALMSDAVDNSFNALRQRVAEEAGIDFLQQLDDVWWGLDRPVAPNEERRNWHMTGRAFAIPRNRILGFPPPVEIVREDTELDTRWRVYVRVDEDLQSGQLGEPLRTMPWDFLSRTGGDVEAYNQGGRLKSEIPAGYYIDLTQLAADYGWQRYPSGPDWRANSETIYYWLFIRPEGLSWLDALLEVYLPGQIGGFMPTPTPGPVDTVETAGQ